MRALLGVALTLAPPCIGCMASSATLQSAQTLAPKKVSIAGGLFVPVSTAFVGEVSDTVAFAGRRARNLDTGDLTEDEKRQIIEGVVAAATLSPSVLLMADLRVGVARNIDLGVRYGGPALGLDGKFQVRDGPWDLAFSLGFRHHTDIGPSVASSVHEVLDTVRLVDYGREDLQTALLFSTDDGRIAGFYGAARYDLSFAKFHIGLSDETSQAIDADEKALIHTLTVGSGLRVGTRHVQFMLELALSYMLLRPRILGRSVDLSGLVVEPGLGMRFNF